MTFSLSLSPLDWAVIAAYFVLVGAVAWWATKNEKETSEDYFLAGRDQKWFLIGASLFASNIGSEHLIGLAGAGAKGGVAVAQFEILAGFILLLLGWIFVPFYLASGVTTMPEFLQIRYNNAARKYLSFISIIAYVITKISVTIFAGAVVFEAIGFDFWLGAFVVVSITGIYTIFGGLKAVIYTDMIQMFVLILGSLLVTIIGFSQVGGWTEFKASLEPSFFSMWRESSHPEFPWTGILFGAPILGVWYWCTDQFIVQRVLAAKNLSHARKGSIFGGFLKQLPLIIFVFPGMLAFVLSQKGLISLETPDHALPALVAGILPVGLKGMVVAGLLAALMSSLSSMFNSCSTLITYDFYLPRNPNASEKSLVVVGQIATVLCTVAGLLWIPLMKYVSGGTLFTYLQSVQAYISPPIAAVFLLGICFKRLNSQGAMAALIGGFILGVLRLGLEMNKSNLDGLALAYTEINFLHFAFFLFVVCSAILIAVSLMTAPPDYAKIDKVTHHWGRKVHTDKDVRFDLILSVLLVLSIVVTWVIFS